MNIQTYSLSHGVPPIQFTINPEMGFSKIAITQFQLSEGNDTVTVEANVKFKHQNKDELIMETFASKTNLDNFVKRLSEKIEQGVNSVQIKLNSHSDTNAKVVFSIHFGPEKLNLETLFNDFRNHIENSSNTKIIFSAPFGHGKTTFLNTFFEESENDRYEVLRVFPVNYSVSNNEDIFRYIKADLLFQLLTKEVEFEKSSISKRIATEEFIYLKPKRVISSLLEIFGSLNSTIVDLTKAINNLSKLKTEIENYQEKSTIDEQKLAIEFINEIYEKEGSLFEDNFYTQLIRGLIEQISQKKETILIIEDLDRIDPEHIFRILNVISAHYDTYHLAKEWNLHNRFGFDKIILVCDYKNIQNIFHHKYGVQTDFNGYFNKYYSSKPFEFDSSALQKIDFIKQLSAKNQNYKRSSSFHLFVFILEILIENRALSIREQQKLYQFHYSEGRSLIKTNSNFSESEIIVNCLFNLEVSIGLEKLKQKLYNIRNNCLPIDSGRILHWTTQLLTIRSFYDGSLSKNYLVNFKRGTYSFTKNYNNIVKSMTEIQTGTEIELYKGDFFDIIIETIDVIIPFLRHDNNQNLV